MAVRSRKIHIPARRFLRLAAPIAAALALWLLAAPFPAPEVSGYRITRAEYLGAMHRARSDVLSDHADAGIALTDWHTETALGDPCRMVMERALELLREYYAVSTLAVERGYLEAAGYDALEQELEAVNRGRQEALEAGSPVTGMPSFTMDDYLTYRASSLRLQFCSDPDNPEYRVTSQELLERYEADRDRLYRQPDSMELAVIRIDAAPGEADELERLLCRVREEGDLAAAAAADPRLAAHYRELTVDAAGYAALDRTYGDVLAWAAGLQAGETSQVLRQGDRLCLIRCLQRTQLCYTPLEDVASVVAQSVRESRYDALIAGRMEQTELRFDPEQLYRFTAKQLP